MLLGCRIQPDRRNQIIRIRDGLYIIARDGEDERADGRGTAESVCDLSARDMVFGLAGFRQRELSVMGRVVEDDRIEVDLKRYSIREFKIQCGRTEFFCIAPGGLIVRPV